MNPYRIHPGLLKFFSFLFLLLGSISLQAQKSKGKTPLPNEILQYAHNVQSGLKPVAQPITGGAKLDRELVATRLREGRRVVEDALLAGEQMSESTAGELHRRMERIANDLISLTSKDKTNSRCYSSCYKSYGKGQASRFWNMFTCLAICLGQ